jgi:outer membrane protein TolC
MRMTHFIGVPTMMLIFLGAVFAQRPGAPAQSSQAGSSSDQAAPAVNVQLTDFSGTQNPLLGGIPSGEPTADVIPLSISEALKRGLNYNLGARLGELSVKAARGARLLALSRLLPKVTTGLNETQQQINLEAFGFQGFPGSKTIVGPFNVFDVRAYVSQTVLDFTALNRYRTAKENVEATLYSDEYTRDMVVFVCANLYLQAVASQSRIEAVRAQVQTAEVLHNLALDQKAAGTVPGIEVLRAKVELQAQQQRLIVAENQFATDKLALARAIGLPLGQEFALSDRMQYVPFTTMSLEEAVRRAYADRPDYQSAQAKVRAAESEWKAAKAERLPTINLSADYGVIGQRPWDSHGTFAVSTNLRIPIFQGGSVRAKEWESEAAMRQREAELEDLKGRIHYDVRNAFLDLKSAADRVEVAQSAVKLADQQVLQSEDRFRAGVTNNVEVVQAQEALATASENYISSLQAHSAAKLALAGAMGISGSEYEQFLRGK